MNVNEIAFLNLDGYIIFDRWENLRFEFEFENLTV